MKKKETVKINPQPSRPTFGVNPMDPWSAKANIAENELEESAGLDAYLKSKGMNPKFVARDTKISISKSPAYISWQQSHQNESVDDNATPERLKNLKARTSAHTEIKTAPVKSTKTRIQEARKTAKEKFAKAAYERSQEHKKFMDSIKDKPHGEQMKAMMDKIKSNLNTEEVEIDESKHTIHRFKMQPGQKVYHGLLGPVKVHQVNGFKTIVKDSTGKLITVGSHTLSLKSEDMMDPKGATNQPVGPGQIDVEPIEKMKRMSRKAKIVKEIYKQVKEDKSVATYGKKPKFEKAEKDEGGEKKPSAAAVLTGGKTLTGEPRDTVEIDPMMRNRPNQPDITKKDDKKDGKKEDKKKDK